MTSELARKTNLHQKSFSCFKLLLCGSLFNLTTGVAVNAADWQQQVVPMAGVTNYAREACITFKQGDVVRYRFESEHPVNFDIHYHPESGTQFKERKDAVTQSTGEFDSEASQAYCFTWKNKNEVNAEWNITLHYTVVPK